MTSEPSRIPNILPSDIYRHRVESGSLNADPCQRRALEEIDRFYLNFMRDRNQRARWAPSLLSSLAKHSWLRYLPDSWRPDLSRYAGGLYLYGGVGRGKSQLCRLLAQALPTGEYRSIHFHEWMSQVHFQLDRLSRVADPMPIIAQRMLARSRVLFVDEFFVVDIVDAMLMFGFLRALFAQGMTLILTSNFAPDELYRGGLQRERFLPAIKLIKKTMAPVYFDSDTDHRQLYLKNQPLYIHSAAEELPSQREKLSALYRDLSQTEPRRGEICCLARAISVRAHTDEIVWFEFEVLCASERSRADYQELAQVYPVLILDGIYPLDDNHNDIVRRFIFLIDILYEAKVKAIFLSTADLSELYTGERLRTEFNRARSRIVEMSSHQWWGLAHLSTLPSQPEQLDHRI